VSAVSRWFVRCRICLAVSAIEEHPASMMQCGLCAGQLENMGRVERDRLVRDEFLCPCDDRCTSAKGPNCTCKCSGKHHGSNLIVHVVRDAGKVPTVTPRIGREQCRINAAEFHAAHDALLRELDPLLAQRRAAGYLPESDYRRMRQLQAANQKAWSLRDHAARMRLFRAVLKAQTFNTAPRPEPSPLEQLASEIPTAQALADVPFSLSREPATSTPKQTSLF